MRFHAINNYLSLLTWYPMKLNWFYSCFLILVCFSPHVLSQSITPYELIQNVGEKTFERVTQEKVKLASDKEYYKVIVEQQLLPYVDYRYAALKALGKHIRKFQNIKSPEAKAQSKRDLQRFVETFKQYLVTIYAGVFTQYTEQVVTYEPAKPVGARKIVIVKSTILESAKPNIHLGFKMRKQKDNSWAAYDMLVEGISLLDAKQAELDGLLKTNSLSEVTSILAKRAAMPVSFNH